MKIQCPQCKTVQNAPAQFCGKCGVQFVVEPEKPSSLGYSRIILGVGGLLILSWFISTNNQSEQQNSLSTVATNPIITNAVPAHGSSTQRLQIASDIRKIENEDSDEKLVLVVARDNELVVTFKYALIDYAQQKFIERHKSQFPRFYDAGFDTLTIEANSEQGTLKSISYGLKDFIGKKGKK